MGKATLAEVELREAAVRQLQLDGASRYDILQFTAKNWNLGVRQTDEYMARAAASIKVAGESRTVNALWEAIEHRRSMRHKAHVAKNYKLELDIAKDEAKLLGLYPAEKHEITGDLTTHVELVEVVRPK